MSKDGMYYKVSQEYSELKNKKRKLMRERDIINTKIEIIEDIMIALDDILCKHGNHIYEHFKEGETQEPEPQECEPENSEVSDE